MENNDLEQNLLDRQIAQRLKDLRAERAWSLDELARRSHVSRATLSRLENAEVSPTTSVLGKLCAAYGLTMSQLMHLVEDVYPPLIRRDSQGVWQDPLLGFRRRSVSPPAQDLAAEVLECELEPGTRITYERPPRSGQEHHLLVLEGHLGISINGQSYDLHPGDCLRYHLFGRSEFVTPAQHGARYILVLL